MGETDVSYHGLVGVICASVTGDDRVVFGTHMYGFDGYYYLTPGGDLVCYRTGTRSFAVPAILQGNLSKRRFVYGDGQVVPQMVVRYRHKTRVVDLINFGEPPLRAYKTYRGETSSFAVGSTGGVLVQVVDNGACGECVVHDLNDEDSLGRVTGFRTRTPRGLLVGVFCSGDGGWVGLRSQCEGGKPTCPMMDFVVYETRTGEMVQHRRMHSSTAFELGPHSRRMAVGSGNMLELMDREESTTFNIRLPPRCKSVQMIRFANDGEAVRVISYYHAPSGQYPVVLMYDTRSGHLLEVVVMYLRDVRISLRSFLAVSVQGRGVPEFVHIPEYHSWNAFVVSAKLAQTFCRRVKQRERLPSLHRAATSPIFDMNVLRVVEGYLFPPGTKSRLDVQRPRGRHRGQRTREAKRKRVMGTVDTRVAKAARQER